MEFTRASNTVWTSLFDLTMFVVNGLIAVYLARQFGPETFSQYIIITSFVSVFTLLTRGIQTSVAEIHSKHSGVKSQAKVSRLSTEVQALFFGLSVSVLWLTFVPFLAVYSNVSILPALSAAVIPPATSVVSVIIGRLQGRHLFFRWRLVLLISTLLQLPLVVVADLFNSPLSVFIIVLVFPVSIVAFIESRLSQRSHAQIIEGKLKPSLIPGLVSVLSMAATQLPLIYLRHEIPNSQSAPLIVYVYVSGLFIGISSTLGSFLMTKYKSEGELNYKSLNHHFINSIPLLLFLFFYFPLGNNLTAVIIGGDFKIDISLEFVVFASLSSILWCVYSSLIYERLNVFKFNFVIGISTMVILEFIIINSFSININLFFILHGLFALASFVFAFFSTK